MKRPAPKKFLSQNFLINEWTIKKIINVCDLNDSDIVLEIGPGEGALTKHIAPKVKYIYAVEKDYQLADELKKNLKFDNLKIIQGDILKFSISQLPQPIKIIGNLPYNISTPIIEKLIEHRNVINEAFIMVQKEFAQRLMAKTSTKSYGSLSCFVQYYFEPQLLFYIKNTHFFPAPKVESAYMRLTSLTTPPIKCSDEPRLFSLIQKSFSQRRKTILNALSQDCPKENLLQILTKLKLNPQLRPENLSLKHFISIAEEIFNSDHPSR